MDALRGILACVVVADHAAQIAFRSLAVDAAAQIAVWCFFWTSGLVLARSYDGRYLPFLARRVVRLAPVYAICVAAGCATQGLGNPLTVDPPTWSLHVEAAACLLFPAIAWAGDGVWRAMAVALLCLAATVLVHSYCLYAAFFVAGSAMRGLPAPRWDGGLVAQWLGRVSYSLYLSHWPVLILAGRLAGAGGVIAAMPVCLAAAWALHRWVELPSIRASRCLR